MVYYPLTTGRNRAEILWLFQALQTIDEHKVAMPANWRPGDKGIVPPPNTQESAKALLKVLSTTAAPEEITKQLGQPLFKVRSSLREMAAA